MKSHVNSDLLVNRLCVLSDFELKYILPINPESKAFRYDREADNVYRVGGQGFSWRQEGWQKQYGATFVTVPDFERALVDCSSD